MLLRNSISNTKKFFRKTIKSFKSFLSGGYEKLPKTPPFNPFSCGDDLVDMKFSRSYKELDKFYSDFSDQWDSTTGKYKAKERRKKKTLSPTSSNEKEIFMEFGKSRTLSPTSSHEKEIFMEFEESSPMKKYVQEEIRDDGKKKRIEYEGKRKAEDLSCPELGVREERSCLVAEKLKELEMMDRSNVEHVLDIEEVLHYYSRLTCPAYLDIVDKFFMDIYGELFSVQASTHANHSRSPLLKW